MGEVVFFAMLIGFPLIAFATGEWKTAALPLVAWPLFYIGLNQRWWGHGTGDGWQLGTLALTLVGVVTTGLAAAAREFVDRRRTSSGEPDVGGLSAPGRRRHGRSSR